MKKIQYKIVAATLIAASQLGTATVGAAPLEGGDSPAAARPECSELQRFVIGAAADNERRKALAIVGLVGPDADDELATVQAAVAYSCS